MSILCLSLLLLGASVSAFRVKSANPSSVKVKQGNSFKVICTTDNWYEFCTFRKGDKSCDIVWKRDPYNVTMGECDDFAGRVQFRGSYDNYECGLEISNADAADDGEWSCDIESYVKYGKRGDGKMATKKFSVSVEIPITTTTAVLITGGYFTKASAEIYHPGRDSPCLIANIPYNLSGHSQDGSLMCGGQDTLRSCQMWNADTGAWDLVTESLTEDRDNHTSWTPADRAVTYLMGGAGSGTTSDILQHDNNKVSTSTSFPLKHDTQAACSIPDPDTDTVVMTGGYYTLTTVSRYGTEGWIEDFSSALNTGRFWHGCASYIDKNNERVLLVTGGIDSSNYERLASTEVYRPSTGEWREVPGGALPRPMWGVHGVTLNNRVLLFGGRDRDRTDYADILEFSDSEGEEKWTIVGEMSKARSFHAVSVVDFVNFKDYCR